MIAHHEFLQIATALGGTSLAAIGAWFGVTWTGLFKRRERTQRE